MSKGATAPPTMLMMSREEAILVYAPSPRRARAKMVGNMMLSQRYTTKSAANPKPPGASTTALVASVAMMAKIAKRRSARMRPIAQLPPRRPSMKSPMPPKLRRVAAMLSVMAMCSVA